LSSVVLSLLLTLAAPANSAPAEFARGKVSFQRAEYARAIELLRPLLYPEVRLESEGEMVQAHRMLGIAHLFQRQNDLAAEEFRRLLQLRPDFRMDALIDPPMVVDFFNSIIAQQEAELVDLENKRREADANAERRRRLGATCPPPTVVERRTIRNSRLVSFIPFGAGQFQNGHSRKGWGFFAAETVFGALSLGALTTNFVAYGFRPTLRCEQGGGGGRGNCPQGYALSSDRSRSELLTKIQVTSGVLFFATAIWGVTDAVLNFEPEVVVTTPQPLPGGPPISGSTDSPQGPEAEASKPAKLSQRSRVSNLRLLPTLLGDGAGGTLAFRF
jgi:hypothetical protein